MQPFLFKVCAILSLNKNSTLSTLQDYSSEQAFQTLSHKQLLPLLTLELHDEAVSVFHCLRTPKRHYCIEDIHVCAYIHVYMHVYTYIQIYKYIQEMPLLKVNADL